MLEEDPDAPIGLLWAEQDGRGVHINISGGGVTRYADDVDLAQQFLEWLATDGQDTLVADNHEYPANPAVEAEPLIRETFGTDFVRDPLRVRRPRLAERRRGAGDGHGELRLTSLIGADASRRRRRPARVGVAPVRRPGASSPVPSRPGDRPDRHAGHERAASEHATCGGSSGTRGSPIRSSRRSC